MWYKPASICLNGLNETMKNLLDYCNEDGVDKYSIIEMIKEVQEFIEQEAAVMTTQAIYEQDEISESSQNINRIKDELGDYMKKFK